MLSTPFYFILLPFLASLSVVGQELIRVEFNADPIIQDTGKSSFATVYRYDSDTVNFRGSTGVLTLQEDLQAADNGYFFSYFAGCENSYFEQAVTVIVENYKSESPRFWVDQNGNLDLSDDGGPVEVLQDGSLVVPFRNSENPDASFYKKFFRRNSDSSETAMLEMLFGKPGKRNSQYLEEVKYWFSTQRMNIKEFRGEIGNSTVRLGIEDYDCDGKFTMNGKDRLMISNDPEGKLPERLIEGVIILEDTSIVKIGEEYYEMIFIEESGRYLELKKTKLEVDLPLSIGSVLPNYNVWLDDEEVTLDQMLDGKDYLFVDIWGSWCKGCLQQLGDVKSFEEKYVDKIRVLGLNYGDSEESMAAFIEEHNLQWPNAELTEEIIDDLYIEAYPTYLLIDKERRLIKYLNRVDSIEEYLKNEMRE